MKYDYKAVEAKWQKVWEDEKTFHVEIDHKKPKFYALVEFPYPSGAGLHVGHPRSYTALDVVSRKRRKNGYNVLYPMGWDAFGLPTENFAMKNHIHPAIVTKKNVDHFREQLKALGFSFDWDREINTTGAKCTDAAIAKIVVDAKSEAEKIVAKARLEKLCQETADEKAAEYKELQNGIASAAARGYVDTVIKAEDTRKYVIGAFEMLMLKREDRPYKKHGTV